MPGANQRKYATGVAARAAVATVLAAADQVRRRARNARPAAPIRKRTARRVTKSRAGTKTITLTRKRKSYSENHSTENRQTSLVVNAPTSSALTLVKACMEPQWLRVQGLSQFDTAVGYYPLGNRNNGTNTLMLPMHVWDLTCSPNITQPGNSVIVPEAGFGCWMNYAGGSNVGATFGSLSSQNAAGTNIGTAIQQYESFSGGYDDLPKRKMFHEWSSIKLNLYGVRKRATKYVVQLVTVKDHAIDFLNGSSTNTEKLKLYDYLARPFMYNNLNSGDPQSKSKIKVIKTYETIIAPTMTDEYGGATATPHMQTLNWFVRHNTVRRYDWARGGIPPVLTDASFDQELGENSTRVDPRQRIYLLIRALAPEVRVTADDRAAADPITEPSYDCVIRNKYLNPT